jgi:carboxyl-terminal processing protease
MDEALAALPGATRLVVDVRDNPGGSVRVAAEVAGRFADRPRTYGYVRLRDGASHGAFTDYIARAVSPAGARAFRGPVYVLTNRRSLSAAEDFVLAMRAMPGVTAVGDTTAGASGGPITRELPNGWTYQLSTWVAYTADRRTFEGVGLPPDVAATPARGDEARGVDAAMDAALARAARR